MEESVLCTYTEYLSCTKYCSIWATKIIIKVSREFDRGTICYYFHLESQIYLIRIVKSRKLNCVDNF